MTRRAPFTAGFLSLLLLAGCGGTEPDVEKPGQQQPEPEPEPDPEPAAPQVFLAAPTDGAQLPFGPVEFRGSVQAEAGLAGLRYELNGADAVEVETVGAADAASFSFTLEPGEGAHTLVFTAVDEKDREATLEVGFEVGEVPDEKAPFVAITSPFSGSFSTIYRINVVGTATDDRSEVDVVYTHNGGEPVAIELGEGGAFAFQVAPTLGENRVRVSAVDEAGNETLSEVTVTFGNVAMAGAGHSGVVVDGNLYTWGMNIRSQLGLGPDVTENQYLPQLVSSLENVASASFNQNQSLAILGDGSVYTWGNNGDGQLGLGSAEVADTDTRSTPEQVAGLTGAVAAAMGYNHTLVLLDDGTVRSFGQNTSGQLGDGTIDDKSYPVQVSGLTDVIKVAAGSKHSVALKADGTVWTWGRNSQGNLGTGAADTDPHSTPVQVPGLAEVVDISSGRDHVIAVLADGTAVGWGLNSHGQVGDGNSGSGVESHVPVAVSGLTGAVATYASGNMSFAVKADGTAWGWGQNFNGQLGSGDTTEMIVPTTAVKGLDNLVGIGVGATHVIARRNDGTVFAWGWNFSGSLGRDDIADRWAFPEPVVVDLP